MAKATLSIDTSDCSAVIKAVAQMADRLPWPHRENFRDEVQELFDVKRAITFVAPPRGAALEVIASSELLDLMRKYEGQAG